MKGKGVIALANGGLRDIVQNGINGYLCNNVDEMVDIIKQGKLDDITPQNCHISAERFNIQNMCNGYMELVNGIMNNDTAFNW